VKRGEVRWCENCDHVQTVAKGKIGPTITTLAGDKMEQIGDAIAFALDL
jgi:mRNA interferase MazF